MDGSTNLERAAIMNCHCVDKCKYTAVSGCNLIKFRFRRKNICQNRGWRRLERIQLAIFFGVPVDIPQATLPICVSSDSVVAASKNPEQLDPPWGLGSWLPCDVVLLDGRSSLL